MEEDEMIGYVARMEEMRNAYKILVGKLVGRRPLGTASRKWQDDIIKVDLREVLYWMQLIHD
jgi:hypothetical protein